MFFFHSTVNVQNEMYDTDYSLAWKLEIVFPALTLC